MRTGHLPDNITPKLLWVLDHPHIQTSLWLEIQDLRLARQQPRSIDKWLDRLYLLVYSLMLELLGYGICGIDF